VGEDSPRQTSDRGARWKSRIGALLDTQADRAVQEFLSRASDSFRSDDYHSEERFGDGGIASQSDMDDAGLPLTGMHEAGFQAVARRMMPLNELLADIEPAEPIEQIDSLFAAGYYAEAMDHKAFADHADSDWEDRWIQFSSDPPTEHKVHMAQRGRFWLCLQMRELGIEGNSAASVHSCYQLSQLARLCSGTKLPNVLIEGEMGSGKSSYGKALHDVAGRTGQFLSVPMATLSGKLAEDTLFGHEKGAFTDAKTSRPGCFEYCEKGTVVLDDITGTPPDCYSKLLTVLEERMVTRLGSNSPVHVNDTLVVATTNLDLSRSDMPDDLIQRLRGNCIRVPDLGSRSEDVPTIVAYFFDEMGSVADCLGWDHRVRIAHRLRQAAMESQLTVRDLRNAINQLVQDSQTVEFERRSPADIEEWIRKIQTAADSLSASGSRVNRSTVAGKLGRSRNYFSGGPRKEAWDEWKHRSDQ